MGLFAEWVMMPTDRIPKEAVKARYAKEGLSADAEVDGWVFARTRGHDPDALVDRLVRAGPEVAMAWWVYDSDFAYLVGTGRDQKRFGLVIGIPYSDSPNDDQQSLSRFATHDGRGQSADELAEWSEANAPKQVSAAEALEILQKDWTLAEEGLGELFHRLGLPNFGDALSVASAPTDARGVVVSLPIHDITSIVAFSLLQRLDRFSRERGVARTTEENTVELDLPEAPTEGDALGELLLEVQRWVEEIGLDRVTVFIGGRARTVERQRPTNLA